MTKVEAMKLTDREKEIDSIDRDLYRLMAQCPGECRELYMALQRARGISYSLLPDVRKKDFGEKGQR